MEIQDVMFKWCRAIDPLDFEECSPSSIREQSTKTWSVQWPRRWPVEWICIRHVTIPFSSHQVSNMLIEFASPTLALAETYVRTLQRYPADAAGALAQMMASGPKSEEIFDMMTSSRYIDRFEKKQGSWKIAFRRLSQEDWKQIFPVTAQTPQNNPDWLSQRRDFDLIVLYEERAKLGIT